MTKKDLIKALENVPDDAHVCIVGKYSSWTAETVVLQQYMDTKSYTIGIASRGCVNASHANIEHITSEHRYASHFRNNSYEILHDDFNVHINNK